MAPTVAYGVNLPCDRFVPGTAGFSFDSLRAFIDDATDDWARQGFRRFFVVTAHGCAMDGCSFAHHEAIKQGVLPLLAGPPCSSAACEASVLFPYWTEIGDILTEQDAVSHACEAETSLMLFLHPELVRMELAQGAAEAQGAREPQEAWGPQEAQDKRFAAFPEGVAAGPPTADFTGAEGAPAAATAEKGRLIFERCLNPMVRHVSERVRGSRS